MSLCAQEFGRTIADLINQVDLPRDRSKTVFSEVLLDRQSAMHQGAFLSALAAKGETAEEIAGIWEAIYEHDTCKVALDNHADVVENCGTGMDSLKTFNISTAASIIAAAAGVVMAKHGSRAITSSCGTIDLLEALGVDVEGPPELVKHSIETAGIGIFNGMSPHIHQSLGRILSQISFGTVLNIAASLANPALPRYAVRGVYDRGLLTPVARVMNEIGYRRALVVHGLDAGGEQGMDEASTLGETLVAELYPDGSIREFSFYPQDYGIKQASLEDLRPHIDREQEVLQFLRVIAGLENGPRTDIACLNAALVIYVTRPESSLADCLQAAREMINKGLALQKLRAWVSAQNQRPERGIIRLNQLLEKM
ncbi:MAG TPA: anthranilate phosphoribosyltransferase [Syntrophomonas sp.]|jgi:anthranilate phosphoribosyltransferase|nr:anthranilate phosphoribosyltransferase [Syntrophomonas sp.]